MMAAYSAPSKSSSHAWLLDFEQFAPALVKIRNKEGQLVKLRLTAAQRYARRLAGSRNVWLKARQLGISTMLQAESYHDAATREGFRCATVAHERDSTQRLNDKLKIIYENLPSSLRPRAGYNSRRELTLKTTGSSIYIGTAGARAFGRGDTLNRVHLSEYAFYPDPSTIFTGISQAVPEGKGRIDVESTANGFNEFHTLWTEAEAGRNGFTPIFLPWFLEPSYCLPDGVPEHEWEKAEKLCAEKAQKYGVALSPGQVAFRRAKESQLRLQGREDMFLQEYAEDPVTAFLLSGRPRFNAAQLTEAWTRAPAPVSEQRLANGLTLRTWQEPKPGEFYTIAADAAQGLSASDNNAAEVMHWATGTTVATLHGKSEIFDFADTVMALGWRYNRAVLAPERKESGIAVVARCKEKSYPELYRRVDEHGPAEEYGVDTNGATRPVMLDALARQIIEQPAVFRDSHMLAEMQRFVIKNNKAQAETGAHDDLVIVAAINRWIRPQVEPPPTNVRRPEKPKQSQI